MLTIIEVITRYKIFKCFDFGFPYNIGLFSLFSRRLLIETLKQRNSHGKLEYTVTFMDESLVQSPIQ